MGPIMRVQQDRLWAYCEGLGRPAVGPIMNFREQQWKVQVLDSLSVGRSAVLTLELNCSHFRGSSEPMISHLQEAEFPPSACTPGCSG